jgi:hypothetical protein
VGSAVSVAQAHVRLARDAHPDTPESVRLSEQQKAELQQYMQQQTLQLLWRVRTSAARAPPGQRS